MLRTEIRNQSRTANSAIVMEIARSGRRLKIQGPRRVLDTRSQNPCVTQVRVRARWHLLLVEADRSEPRVPPCGRQLLQDPGVIIDPSTQPFRACIVRQLNLASL